MPQITSISPNDKVLVILTGGTIDACSYGNTPQNITPLQSSIIPSALEKLGLAEVCNCFCWLRKDSKDFSLQDMVNLAVLIREQGYKRVVITHGTDRMPDNSRVLVLLRKVFGLDVTVIFTGAMTPIANQLEGIQESDGYENLRFSIEQAQQAKPGVYIGFHQTLFDPLYTIKNFPQKKFEMVSVPFKLELNASA